MRRSASDTFRPIVRFFDGRVVLLPVRCVSDSSMQLDWNLGSTSSGLLLVMQVRAGAGWWAPTGLAFWPVLSRVHGFKSWVQCPRLMVTCLMLEGLRMKAMTSVWDHVGGWSTPLPALDSPSTLVVIFGDRAVEDDSRPVREVVASFSTSVVIGCSTSGQIAGASLRDDVCVVAIARFDHVRLARAGADVSSGADSFAAGVAVGAGLAGEDLRAVFVLSDGLCVNGSELVAGLISSVGPDVSVTGGLAGDGDRFERTWVIDKGHLRAGRVVAVGLYGDGLLVGSGSEGGWSIFGPERVVTRSEGNVLYELDGKPALALYKRYLGDMACELPASALLFPLAIRAGDEDEQLVRTVLGVDEVEQSMTFAGDVPQGWRAQLMRSSADRLVDGAEAAAVQSSAGFSSAGSTLGIAISCVGRRLVLGARTEEEIEATLEALPPATELIGFYSYGEIAPGLDGACDLHNQTMTITTLAEA